MSRYIAPVQYALDGNGKTIAGAKLYFYETGTTTLKTIYSDSGLSVTTANPAIADSNGQFSGDIFLDGIYAVVFKDDLDVTIWTKDPIGATGSGQFELWTSDNSYDVPDIVKASDNNYYQSKTNGNQGNDPTTSAANWEKISFIIDDSLTLTGNMTYGTVSTVTGSAVATLRITGLTIDANREITGRAHIIGASAASATTNITLEINQDTTLTNYYRVESRDSAVPAKDNIPGQNNGLDTGDICIIDFVISQNSTTDETMIIMNTGTWDSSAVAMRTSDSVTRYTVSGTVTSVGFNSADASLAFDVGSKLIVKQE